MRKIALLSIAIIAILALMAAPIAFACGDKANAEKASSETTCATKANAKLVSDKAACSAKTDGKLINDKAACTASANAKQASDKAACASKETASHANAYECTPEQMEACAKTCGGKGTMVAFAVNGMTCTGCENGLKASLSKMEGVNNVTKVCYKSGEAVVCYNADKIKSDDLIKAITNKGYTADIIPAVAKSTDGKASLTDAHKTCSAAEKAACTAAEKAACSAKSATKEIKKETKGSL